MKKLLFIMLMALQLISVKGQNEVNFLKHYEPRVNNTGFPHHDSRLEVGRKIIKDKSIGGGYFIIGQYETGSPIALLNFAGKLDNNGAYVWSKSAYTDHFSDVDHISGNELLFASGVDQHFFNGRGFKMMVTDNTMTTISWRMDYATNGACNAAIESVEFYHPYSCDGVVGCGRTQANKLLVVKADRYNGSIIWANMYDFGGLFEEANDVKKTQDGGYIVTGRSDNYLLIFKTDRGGTLQWSEKLDLGPGNSAVGNVVEYVPDGSSYSILVGADVTGLANKALVVKRDPLGTFTMAISNLSSATTIHSLEMRNANTIMIAGSISGNKSYTSTLELSNISNTTLGREYDIFQSRSTTPTVDNSFITIGNLTGGQQNSRFYVYKTKSDGLVNCLGQELNFPMIPQVKTNIAHTPITLPSTFIAGPSLLPSTNQTQVDFVCCYLPNAQSQTIDIHAKCKESVTLNSGCENFTNGKWYENGVIIPGASGSTYTFTAEDNTIISAKRTDEGGCVYCVTNYNIIIDPPDVCFTLPEIICINQPIVPVFTCDMNGVVWHQWVITELNGAWEDRIVKAQFPSSGPPSEFDIKTLWNGFEAGKCYGLSLDIFDECGKSNTLYRFFCIPAVLSTEMTLFHCPLDGNDGLWLDPGTFFAADHFTSHHVGGTEADYHSQGNPPIYLLFLANNDYVFEYFDAGGCLIRRITLHVLPKAIMPPTECFKTVTYCEFLVDIEGVRPDCQECYRDEPPFKLMPLEVVFVNSGVTRYRRSIIDKENCRECVFTFDVVDKACDFTPDFNISYTVAHPDNLTLTNLSTSGPGTTPCGLTWSITDITDPFNPGFTLLYTDPIVNFTGVMERTYRICLNVTYCACGRECSRIICKDIHITLQGPEIKEDNTSTDPTREGNTSSVKTLDNKTITIREDLGLAIKPNPSSDKFTVFNLSGVETYDMVTIYGLNGQVIIKQDLVAANHEFDLSAYAKGIYMIKIDTGNQSRVLKLILQ